MALGTAAYVFVGNMEASRNKPLWACSIAKLRQRWVHMDRKQTLITITPKTSIMEILELETMEQVHKFFGSRKSITKISARGLMLIRDEAKANLGLIHVRRHEEYTAAEKMQANGSIACRRAIIDRMDQLLRQKTTKRKIMLEV